VATEGSQEKKGGYKLSNVGTEEGKARPHLIPLARGDSKAKKSQQQPEKRERKGKIR